MLWSKFNTYPFKFKTYKVRFTHSGYVLSNVRVLPLFGDFEVVIQNFTQYDPFVCLLVDNNIITTIVVNLPRFPLDKEYEIKGAFSYAVGISTFLAKVAYITIAPTSAVVELTSFISPPDPPLYSKIFPLRLTVSTSVRIQAGAKKKSPWDVFEERRGKVKGKPKTKKTKIDYCFKSASHHHRVNRSGRPGYRSKRVHPPLQRCGRSDDSKKQKWTDRSTNQHHSGRVITARSPQNRKGSRWTRGDFP